MCCRNGVEVVDFEVRFFFICFGCSVDGGRSFCSEGEFVSCSGFV